MKRITFLLFALVLLLVISGCNSAPTINSFSPSSSKITVNTGETIHFSVSASEPDKNTTLTYSWVFKAGSPLSATGFAVDWTAPDAPTTTEAVVTVSDGKKSVTKKWEITVKESSPTIPSNLTSIGTKGMIILNWEASTGDKLTSYYVYRGTSPDSLSKIATVNAPSTSYQDTNVADGVLYYYHVTAFGPSESEPSNQTYNMHGTRLTNTTDDFKTTVADSPYVIENNIVFAGGLDIIENTQLYVMPGAKVVFSSTEAALIYVDRGKFGTKGLKSNPIYFSSTGGGYELCIIAAAEGSQFEYTEFKDLAGVFDLNSVIVSSCSPTISHCRFIDKDDANITTASLINSGATITYCYFSGLSLKIEGSVEDTLNISSNIFVDNNVALLFSNFTDTTTVPATEMIQNNVFECNGTTGTSYYTADLAILAWTDVACEFLLGGNYFFRSNVYDTALTRREDFIVFYSDLCPNQTFNFDNLLTVRPTGIGPGWGALPF